jgi:hypothetical protein
MLLSPRISTINIFDATPIVQVPTITLNIAQFFFFIHIFYPTTKLLPSPSPPSSPPPPPPPPPLPPPSCRSPGLPRLAGPRPPPPSACGLMAYKRTGPCNYTSQTRIPTPSFSFLLPLKFVHTFCVRVRIIQILLRPQYFFQTWQFLNSIVSLLKFVLMNFITTRL